MPGTDKSDLHPLFHPESIALVGVPRGFKAQTLFLLGLKDQDFKGPIYPVHPQADEIHGLKAYPRITDIPGPLDQVIILTPADTVGEIIDQCAKKKVKAVVIYSSGFGETGDEEGQRREEKLRQAARKGGFRILGPNCMGIFSPASGLAFFPGMPKTPGKVGFLSQSGSISNLFTSTCAGRNIFFRHVVSCGNSSDIDLPELIDYMGMDDEVKVICAYCEGVKDGKALKEALRDVSGKKPLIMWKVGDTGSGKRAAASHTGSLSGREEIWKALFRQYGVIEVSDIEEMLDALTAFYYLPLETEGRVVILSGPGGPAVSAADAAERAGLKLAALEDETKEKLRSIIPATGTSVRNPVDVGLAASFDLKQYLDSIEIIAGDTNVDAIVVIGGGLTPDANKLYVKEFARLGRETGKALIAIAYPGFQEESSMAGPLQESGIPVFPTPERALRAYAKILK